MKSRVLFTLLICIFAFCAVACKNEVDSFAEGPIEIPSFSLSQSSRGLNLSVDENDRAEWMMVTSTPVLSGFQSGEAQSSYKVNIYGEEVELKLLNSRKEPYSGLNAWWNTDGYIFEGSSENVFIHCDVSKDSNMCSYLQAIEFGEGQLEIAYCDNVSFSDEGDFVQGLVRSVEILNDGSEDSVFVLSSDWFCDGDISAQVFYYGIYDELADSDFSGLLDGYDWNASIGVDSVVNLVNHARELNLKTPAILTHPEFYVKDMKSGEVKDESDKFPAGGSFLTHSEVQGIVSQYSDKWRLEGKSDLSAQDYRKIAWILHDLKDTDGNPITRAPEGFPLKAKPFERFTLPKRSDIPSLDSSVKSILWEIRFTHTDENGAVTEKKFYQNESLENEDRTFLLNFNEVDNVIAITAIPNEVMELVPDDYIDSGCFRVLDNPVMISFDGGTTYVLPYYEDPYNTTALVKSRNYSYSDLYHGENGEKKNVIFHMGIPMGSSEWGNLLVAKSTGQIRINTN